MSGSLDKGEAAECDPADVSTAVLGAQNSEQKEGSENYKGDIKASTQESGTSASGASKHPDPISQYEDGPWDWESDAGDYVKTDEGGKKTLYTDYQTEGLSGQQPLQGDEFQIIQHPKKFFVPGRIFATEWFEPATEDVLNRQPPPPALVDSYQGPKGGKAIVKLRWFVAGQRQANPPV
ncbi:hypothetical protein VTH82DRAFT_7741 [Thermothelomyces myriococcoides]